MKLELQHVSIPMPKGGHDLARRFYGELLGMEESDVPAKLDAAELIWFHAGGDNELHCFETDETPAPSQHFCLRLDAAGSGRGLDELRAKLEAAGFECEDTTPIVGRPRFMTHDPFGNRVELTVWD